MVGPPSCQLHPPATAETPAQMRRIVVQILVQVVIPMLGAVLLFVINPGKVRLRWRLAALLIASLSLAPFVALMYAASGEPWDWRIDLVGVLWAGPLIVLWIAGVGAIALFIQTAFRRARHRRTSGDQAAS